MTSRFLRARSDYLSQKSEAPPESPISEAPLARLRPSQTVSREPPEASQRLDNPSNRHQTPLSRPPEAILRRIKSLRRREPSSERFTFATKYSLDMLELETWKSTSTPKGNLIMFSHGLSQCFSASTLVLALCLESRANAGWFKFVRSRPTMWADLARTDMPCHPARCSWS